VTRASVSVPMHPRPPRPTLFPYTTLFRSRIGRLARQRGAVAPAGDREARRGGQGDPDPPRFRDLGIEGRACASPTGTPQNSDGRSEEHTSELQSRENLVCRLLLEKKKK